MKEAKLCISKLEEMNLYTLQPDFDYNIYTGHIKGGRQVILHDYGDSLIAVYFDAEGNFLSYEEQVFTNFHAEYDAAIKSWMDK